MLNVGEEMPGVDWSDMDRHANLEPMQKEWAALLVGRQFTGFKVGPGILVFGDMGVRIAPSGISLAVNLGTVDKARKAAWN